MIDFILVIFMVAISTILSWQFLNLVNILLEKSIETGDLLVLTHGQIRVATKPEDKIIGIALIPSENQSLEESTNG